MFPAYILKIPGVSSHRIFFARDVHSSPLPFLVFSDEVVVDFAVGVRLIYVAFALPVDALAGVQPRRYEVLIPVAEYSRPAALSDSNLLNRFASFFLILVSFKFSCIRIVIPKSCKAGNLQTIGPFLLSFSL